MTMQNIKACLSKVYERRKTDLELSSGEREQLLGKKYPVKNLLGNRTIKARMEPVLDTFQIRSANEEYLDGIRFRTLSDQLYLEHKMLQKDTLELRRIVDVLRLYLKAGCRYSTDPVAMEGLFDYAFDLYLYDSKTYPGPNGDEALDRQVKAARRLRRYTSQDWTVTQGRIRMEKSTMEELQRELDRLIAQTGGLTVLKALFEIEFKRRYNQRLDRFLILRPKRSGQDYLVLPQEAVPLNYLIQLAQRHIVPPVGTYLPQTANIGGIVRLAQDMMTVLHLTDPENMSDILALPRDMPEYITDNAQYDSLCIPFQYTTDFCEWLVEKLYLPFAQKAGFVSIKRAYLPVLRWCLQQPQLAFFRVEDIQHGTGLGLTQIKEVLDICAQKMENVNQGFHSLADQINASQYPLIQLPDGLYFQLDPHLSGYAFCECIYRQIKSRSRDFDRNLGIPLENIIKSKLRERKIPFTCGSYTDIEGKSRDCDVVLEGADRILFIEIKKRPLPEEFQQGDSLEIFSALADGMVYGEVQALRHREMLRRDGELTLHTDAGDTTIYLRGRSVYTMSVCLPEYAFFTTSTIAQKILHILNGSISATDPAQEYKLKKFNRLAAEFRSILQSNGARDLRRFFHNCTFRSLHQLWTVLKLCDDGDVDRLIRLLICDTIVSTYNLDFYHSLLGALEFGQ